MTPIRLEYEDMTRRFFELGEQFGSPFDLRTREALLAAIRAFEAMDRHVDAIATRPDRENALERIVARLEGTDVALAPELAAHTDALARLLDESDIRTRFIRALSTFFVHTETLRATTDRSTYARCIVEEARATAAMTACLVPALYQPPWSRWFVRLAETANLLDKLHDVRADRRAGEITIDPGLRLYLRLVTAFVRSALGTMLAAPRPLSVVRWGIPFILAPLTTRLQFVPDPRRNETVTRVRSALS